MRVRHFLPFALWCIASADSRAQPGSGDLVTDLTLHRSGSGVAIWKDGAQLHISWPIAEDSHGGLVLNLRPKEPLIAAMGIARTVDGPISAVIRDVSPGLFLTVGVRDLSTQGWDVFFDNPRKRPHETFAAVLAPKRVRAGARAGAAPSSSTGYPLGRSAAICASPCIPAVRSSMSRLSSARRRRRVPFSTMPA